MSTFTTILLIAVLAGGAYFAYWAIQKTLAEKDDTKPEKPIRPGAKPEGHNNKHHNQRH